MAKRAASAYWLWLSENRTSLIEAHGLEGKRSSEVSKKAGEVWKAMDPTEKELYEELAAKDKQRYEQEVETFGKRVRMPTVVSRTGKKIKKDMYAPKQPLSAFFMWVRDCRQNVKSMPAHGVLKNVTYETWKGIGEDIKKNYEEKAAKAKERYQKDLDLYHLRRASLMSGREGSLSYSQWCNVAKGSCGDDVDDQDTDICECGEKLNGMTICEQCGSEAPSKKVDVDGNPLLDDIDIEAGAVDGEEMATAERSDLWFELWLVEQALQVLGGAGANTAPSLEEANACRELLAEQLQVARNRLKAHDGKKVEPDEHSLAA